MKRPRGYAVLKLMETATLAPSNEKVGLSDPDSGLIGALMVYKTKRQARKALGKKVGLVSVWDADANGMCKYDLCQAEVTP